MNSKNLIVLALVGVVVLTGALIVSTSDMRNGADRTPRTATTQTPRSAEGSLSGESTQTSVEVVSDNVETSVTIK